MFVRCLVSCLDPHGVPVLFPVVVECSEEGLAEGEHCEVASWMAERHGHEEAGLVYDEHAGCSPWLFLGVDWEGAPFAPAAPPMGSRYVACPAGVAARH